MIRAWARRDSYVTLRSPVCYTKHLHQHIQRKHPESHLSPKLKGSSIPDDTLDLTAMYMDQDVDEPIEANIGQPSETEPIVPRLSYSVGYLTDHLSILKNNDHSSSYLEVQVGGFRAMVDGESSTILNFLRLDLQA